MEVPKTVKKQGSNDEVVEIYSDKEIQDFIKNDQLDRDTKKGLETRYPEIN